MDFGELALEHPRLRRVIMGVVAVLIAVGIVATHDGDWSGGDVASVLVPVPVGAAFAVVIARIDDAFFRASPQRALRWSEKAGFLAVVIGVATVPVLVSTGLTNVGPVAAGFSVGFLLVAMWVYPLRAVRAHFDRDATSR